VWFYDGPGALLASSETFTAHSQILRFRVVCCKFTCTGTTFCFDYKTQLRVNVKSCFVTFFPFLYSVMKINVEIDIKKCIYQLCSKPNLFRLWFFYSLRFIVALMKLYDLSCFLTQTCNFVWAFFKWKQREICEMICYELWVLGIRVCFVCVQIVFVKCVFALREATLVSFKLVGFIT